jgi:hypothetical protein
MKKQDEARFNFVNSIKFKVTWGLISIQSKLVLEILYLDKMCELLLITGKIH